MSTVLSADLSGDGSKAPELEYGKQPTMATLQVPVCESVNWRKVCEAKSVSAHTRTRGQLHRCTSRESAVLVLDRDVPATLVSKRIA
jgi:hypothetical protein